MTIKRIHREIKDLEKEDLGGMSLAPSENNLFNWKASIPGPEGSPYEGGVFNLVVELANDYPYVSLLWRGIQRTPTPISAQFLST
jgi:ubiquitin-conjugating enzyme E2 D/E